MALDVTIFSPTGSSILLKTEQLTYGIHRNIIVGQRANKDETKTMDVQASLLNISITGILTSVADMQALITAAKSWWVAGSTTTSDVSNLAEVQWHNRPRQYMVIQNLSITDMVETDIHEFEYTLELSLDTRT